MRRVEIELVGFEGKKTPESDPTAEEDISPHLQLLIHDLAIIQLRDDIANFLVDSIIECLVQVINYRS